MSEENKKVEKPVSLKDILRQLNIEVSGNEDIIEFLLNCSKTFSLDMFPFIINNYEKYNKVEIFYQKYLDKELSKHEFQNSEQKYHQFIKTLWIYTNVYVKVSVNNAEFKKNYYARKNKGKLKKSLKYLTKASQNINEFEFIDSFEDLESLLYLATREISQVLFYFSEFKLLICLNGCSGLIYFGDELFFDKLQDVAWTNQLFFLNRFKV